MGKDLGKEWNEFIGLMLKAKERWRSYQEDLLISPVKNLEAYPLEAQRVFTKFRKMQFEVMLGNFAFYAMTSGGLESLLVPEQEKVIIKKEAKENG